jgi:hypothetical protein
MKEAVLHIYAVNLRYAQALLADIPDARLAEQPAAGMNHPAWVIGHLANTYDFMGSFFDLDAACEPQWKALFAGGTQPVTQRDVYPDKATLLDALQSGHKRVAQAFTEASEETFSAPLTIDRLKDRFPTVDKMVTFGLTMHEGLHLGQVSAWRRLLGMEKVF